MKFKKKNLLQNHLANFNLAQSILGWWEFKFFQMKFKRCPFTFFLSKTTGQNYTKFGMCSICWVRRQEIKQETHGPHGSSEKADQIHKAKKYIVTLIRGRINPLSLFEVWMVLVCKTLSRSPSPKDALCQVWLKIAQWVCRIFKLGKCIFTSCYVIISLWKRTLSLTWISFTQECFVPILSETGSVEEIFKFQHCVFAILNYLPLEKAMAFFFFLTNLIPHHPKMFLPSLIDIGPVVMEKKILKYCKYRQIFQPSNMVLEKIKMLKVYRRTTSWLELSAQMSYKLMTPPHPILRE